MCREPINKGKAQIDVFGRTAGGHVKLPTFRQELLDRGPRSFEGPAASNKSPRKNARMISSRVVVATNDISTTRLEKARATTPARWAWRLFRRVSTRLGDLAVLDRGRAGDADGSDNLAIRYEGNAAFERRGSAQRERAQPEAALRHQVLEHLAGAPVVKRAARFILGDRDRAVLRVVQFVQHHDMASAVEDGDRHAPVVFHGLRLRGRHHFFRCLKPNGRSIGRCRRCGRRLLSAGGCRRYDDGNDGSEYSVKLHLHVVSPVCGVTNVSG